MLKIKPNDGMLVRDPITMRALPPEGAEVAATSFWIRRLAAGDVIEIPAEDAPAKEKSK